MKTNNALKKGALLLVFSFLLMSGAFAQDAINKGAWLIGAKSDLSFTSQSVTGGSSTSTFAMGLAGGYFFMDNLAAGLLFQLNAPSGGTTSTNIGPFVRYYIQGKYFVGAGVIAQSAGGASVTQIPLEAGVALFITDNIAVEPSLNFITYSGGSTFGIRAGFSLYLNRN